MKKILTLVSMTAISLVIPALAQPGNSEPSSITVQATGLNCSTRVGSGAFAAAAWSFGGTTNQGGIFSFGDLSVNKNVDECSAALFGQLASGKILPQLTLAQKDSTNNPVVTVGLKSVTINSDQFSGEASGMAARESVSFRFQQITITHVPSGSHFCWDAAKRVACN